MASAEEKGPNEGDGVVRAGCEGHVRHVVVEGGSKCTKHTEMTGARQE
jgi:hypothetical protein